MIARTEAPRDDIWSQLAARLPADAVQWRQQGKGKAREGKFFAPFVAYIDAQFVRERLDAVASGEWNLTLETLPNVVFGTGEEADEPMAFKARLDVLGVIREDVGTGKDYKTASTDAFKRAAVRFGIGHELYTDYEILWVQVDGDGKYAKAVEDPAQVYARKQGKPAVAARNESPVAPDTQTAPRPDGGLASPASSAAPSVPDDEPSCPTCGGRMWDNRLTKRNPKAPNFKCRSRSCDGVIWPPRAQQNDGDDDGPQHGDTEALKELPF